MKDVDPLNRVSQVYLGPKMQCIVYLESGTLHMTSCILNNKYFFKLSFIVKNYNNIILGVVAIEDSQLNIKSCELRGHTEKETIGNFSFKI